MFKVGNIASLTKIFTSPVFFGDTITASVIVSKFRKDKPIIALATECTDKDDILVLE